MVKLIVCLVCGMATAVCILQLRHQRLELAHQCDDIHNRIVISQIKLWNQQLQIAILTAPNAIALTVQQHDLTLVPSKPFVPANVEPSRNIDGD